MHSPLSGIIRRTPVTVVPQQSVQQALQIMEQHRIGSVIIVAPDDARLLGIFTLQDLLRRVALPRLDTNRPISSVMTRDPVSLPPDATAYQAALLMAKHSVRHLPIVTVAGRLTGVVSQNDLFALQQAGVKEVASTIASATDVAALKEAAVGIRQLAHDMLVQGVGAERLTHFISALNDLLTLRAIELTAAQHDLPNASWCWLALGSEGRYEQTFSTDQDNGVIFDCPRDQTEQVRQQLQPFAAAVNRTLDACGFPLCKGNIMAGNPMWCLSLQEWKQRFGSWIKAAEPQALLFASIFFDFRPLYGAEALAISLREWLLEACASQPLFLRLMASNVLDRRPPLGLFRNFIFDRPRQYPGTIDLKMHGAWFFVDGARILALAHGVSHTSTAQRLHEVMRKMEYSSADAAAILDSFYYIQLLRLRQQQQPDVPVEMANRINPYALNELERRVLKEALRQAGKLQTRLRLDYQL